MCSFRSMLSFCPRFEIPKTAPVCNPSCPDLQSLRPVLISNLLIARKNFHIFRSSHFGTGIWKRVTFNFICIVCSYHVTSAFHGWVFLYKPSGCGFESSCSHFWFRHLNLMKLDLKCLFYDRNGLGFDKFNPSHYTIIIWSLV